MFKDREKALREMEQALLEDEGAEAFEEDVFQEDFDDGFDDDFDDDFVDEYEDTWPEDDREEEKGGISLLGLALIDLLLMGGILAVASWWVFRFLEA